MPHCTTGGPSSAVVGAFGALIVLGTSSSVLGTSLIPAQPDLFNAYSRREEEVSMLQARVGQPSGGRRSWPDAHRSA